MSYVGIVDRNGKLTKRAILKARVIWDGLKATEWPLKNIISFETYMKAFELWLATKPDDLTEEAFTKWFDVNYPQVKEQMDILQAVNNMQKRNRILLKRQLGYAEKQPRKDQTHPIDKAMIQRQKYLIEHGGLRPPRTAVHHKGYIPSAQKIRKVEGNQYGKGGALDLYMKETKEGIKADIKGLAKRLENTPYRNWSSADLMKVQQYPDLLEALLKEQRKKGHY